MLQEIGEKVKPISKYAAKATLPAGLVLASVWGEVRQGNAELELGQIANQDFSHSLFLDQKSAVDQAIENLGLNIPSLAELQQNPAERYFINTSFIDRTGNQVFLGVTNTEGGISPNPECAVPSVHIYINNAFLDRFQLNGANYNICQVFIESISVSSRSLISLSVSEQLAENGRTFLRGGTTVDYYGNWRDRNSQIRLPDAGISNIETNRNPNPLIFVENEQRYLHLLQVINAADSRNNGNRSMESDSAGHPLAAVWSGPRTPSPTETRTATATSTRTSTAQPTFTPEPTRTITPTASIGLRVRVVSLAENPVEFGWQNMPNTAANVILRIRNSNPEVAATLPATATVFRDNTVYGRGEFVCYTTASIGFRNEFLGLSNLLCLVTGTRSETGAPAGAGVSLDGNTVRFSYTPPLNPAEARAVFVVLPTQRLIPGEPGSTSIVYDSRGVLTGSLLLASRENSVTGNSNFFITVPVTRS